MFTTAIIGPDGAGKSTVLQQLEAMLPLPTKRVYMGIKFESSNLILPTTRLLLAFRRARGHRRGVHASSGAGRVTRRPEDLVNRVAGRLRSTLLFANLVAEEWFRQAVAWYYRRRGYLVLFDRHFIADYHAFDVADTSTGRPVGTRVHGFLLNHFYPRPDLVIYLDAPPEVLFERKGELTLERIANLRQGYLQLQSQVKHFATVDATQPQEKVINDVNDLILNFYQARGGSCSIKRNVGPKGHH